jgi:hypothetical protein
MDTKKETPEIPETPPEKKERLSSVGREAMQGVQPVGSEIKTSVSEQDAKNLSNDIPGLEPANEANSGSTQVENLSLQDRHRTGIDYAVDQAEVQTPGIVSYRKMSGAVGEGVHLSSNGGSVGLVSDLNDSLGNHNKVFDASSNN